MGFNAQENPTKVKLKKLKTFFSIFFCLHNIFFFHYSHLIKAGVYQIVTGVSLGCALR